MCCSLVIKIIVSAFDIFLANKIGAEAIGVYGLIMSIYMFCVTVATSGVNLAATKVIAEEIEKENTANVPRIIKRCFLYKKLFSFKDIFYIVIMVTIILI